MCARELVDGGGVGPLIVAPQSSPHSEQQQSCKTDAVRWIEQPHTWCMRNQHSPGTDHATLGSSSGTV